MSTNKRTPFQYLIELDRPFKVIDLPTDASSSAPKKGKASKSKSKSKQPGPPATTMKVRLYKVGSVTLNSIEEEFMDALSSASVSSFRRESLKKIINALPDEILLAHKASAIKAVLRATANHADVDPNDIDGNPKAAAAFLKERIEAANEEFALLVKTSNELEASLLTASQGNSEKSVTANREKLREEVLDVRLRETQYEDSFQRVKVAMIMAEAVRLDEDPPPDQPMPPPVFESDKQFLLCADSTRNWMYDEYEAFDIAAPNEGAAKN